ncbi:hypothetical protein HZS_3743 [Henneguya salminicola]|nr:hypothetical protein HZS_3743 [Henneguya salminicola]
MELPEIMKNKDIIKLIKLKANMSVPIIYDITELYNLFTDLDTNILSKDHAFLCEKNNQKARSTDKLDKTDFFKQFYSLFNIINIDLANKIKFEYVGRIKYSKNCIDIVFIKGSTILQDWKNFSKTLKSHKILLSPNNDIVRKIKKKFDIYFKIFLIFKGAQIHRYR